MTRQEKRPGGFRGSPAKSKPDLGSLGLLTLRAVSESPALNATLNWASGGFAPQFQAATPLSSRQCNKASSPRLLPNARR